VLNRHQVKALKKAEFKAVRGFFEEEGGADDGFEWDIGEEGAKEAEEDAVSDLDIDTI
jgi:hypothetical protein